MPGPLAIQRHASEAGSSEIVERPPHPALRGAVHGYMGFIERSSGPVRRRERPQEQVTLILGFGQALDVSGPGAPARAYSSFVAPVSPSYAITEFAGVSHGIQVDMSPLAASALLEVPMGELPLVVELEDLLGREAGRLVERLYEAPGWAARFDMLDRTLGRRLEEGAPAPPDVAWAWRRLRETHGRLPIGALAQELGCSHRHLTARFHEHVGPTPKTVARIMRFGRVVERLSNDDGARLAEVAYDCGYYDQAHLNRDFRELAGTTPLAYLASRRPDGLGASA